MPQHEEDPDLTAEVRAFWDEDATGYDNSPTHHPRRPQERAAWSAALRRLLPPPPAAVLDMGAGTGFLSLLLAAQGYQVTAADLSGGMLARLAAKAAEAGLEVTCTQTDALQPPEGSFDAVVERHLLWTLTDPGAALTAWRKVAPQGRLVVFEGTWNVAAGLSVGALRAAARRALEQLRGTEPAHHDHYSSRVRNALPYGHGLSVADAVELVEASGWGKARLERLRDVEWSMVEARGLLEEIIGVHPYWAVLAGS